MLQQIRYSIYHIYDICYNNMLEQYVTTICDNMLKQYDTIRYNKQVTTNMLQHICYNNILQHNVTICYKNMLQRICYNKYVTKSG